MPLSCYCDYYDDYEWFYYSPVDYTKLDTTKRKRCSSCGSLIDINATVAKFNCFRPPKDEIEEKIYGEDGEIEMAPKYLCEECADIYFSLFELGFECVSPEENMRELLEEYKELY